MTQNIIVIGSRGSALALWQARHIAAALAALGAKTRLEIIKTTGDSLVPANAGLNFMFSKVPPVLI